MTAKQSRALDRAINKGDENRLEKVIEFLTTAHLSIHGGYPYDYTRWHGRVIVAALDHDGATRLDTYTVATLLEWYKEAKQYQRENRGADFIEAMYETNP